MKAPLLVFLVLCGVSPADDSPAPTRETLVARFTEGVAALNKQYWSPALNIWLDRPGDDLRGHYDRRRNPPWWPSANAVEVLIDFMNITGSSEYDGTIAALYELQKDRSKRMARVVAELKRRGQWNDVDEANWQRRERGAPARKARSSTEYYSDFQNEYLDDSGWWAITWLKMYDRTKNARYLATARNIHAHMATNWKPEKGGGVLWCEDADKQRPNAITNNLFLILSARLHARTKEKSYLEWAEKTLRWIDDQKLYDNTAIVDAPGHRGDYWSYNQGTYLGGLIALAEATGKAEHVDRLVHVAGTVLRDSGLVSANGVVVEKLGTKGDANLFKGVFARYLGQLRDFLRSRRIHPETSNEIDRVLRASVASMLRHSVGADGLYTAEWHEGAKDRAANFNTQTSALAALVSVVEPKKN